MGCANWTQISYPGGRAD